MAFACTSQWYARAAVAAADLPKQRHGDRCVIAPQAPGLSRTTELRKPCSHCLYSLLCYVFLRIMYDQAQIEVPLR